MAISQIVAIKTNGSEYNTIPPNVKGSGAGGNGGSVAKASNTSLLDGVSVARYNSGVFGSTVINNNDADKAIDAGTFAYNNNKPVAKRYSVKLNTLNNSVLQSGASQPSLIQSIHYIKVCTMGCSDGVRTRRLTSAIRDNRFNLFTGEFEAGYPVVAADNFDQDNATRPTRTDPGSLTYKSSSVVPVNDSYKSKTG